MLCIVFSISLHSVLGCGDSKKELKDFHHAQTLVFGGPAGMSKESRTFCKTSAGFPVRCAGNFVPLRSDVQNISGKMCRTFLCLCFYRGATVDVAIPGRHRCHTRLGFHNDTEMQSSQQSQDISLCAPCFSFQTARAAKETQCLDIVGETTKWKMCRVLIYLFQGRVPNGIVVVQGTLNTTNARRKTKQSNWSRP